MVTLNPLPQGFPGGSDSKASACNAGDPGSIPGSGRFPGEGNGNPTAVLLPGKFHGQRSLVCYSPWGHKEWDTTERLHSLTHLCFHLWNWGFPGTPDCKEFACNVADQGLIPRSGRFPGEGTSYPFQSSCLENFMDRGAWWARVHEFAKSET